MIIRFRHKGLKRLYDKNDPRGLPPDMIDRVEDILALLDVAGQPGDLDRPALRLHPLQGGLQGYWAVTVRSNWRIVFRFENGNVCDVDFVDYHQGERP